MFKVVRGSNKPPSQTLAEALRIFRRLIEHEALVRDLIACDIEVSLVESPGKVSVRYEIRGLIPHHALIPADQFDVNKAFSLFHEILADCAKPR